MHRAAAKIGLALALFVAVSWPSDALAQVAVVERNVNLRVDPSTDEEPVRLLTPPEQLTLLDGGQKTQGYYHAVTAQGEDGYVWARNVRVDTTQPAPAAPGLAGPVVFHGCPPEGSASTDARRALNRLKNRNTAHAQSDLDSAVTLQALLQPGDDTNRWSTASAAEITGLVIDVKPGGVETCNCRDTEAEHKDTHIEMVVSAADSAKRRRVIVEVTPRWRHVMAAQGEDWSTTALRTRLRNRRVTMRGWLFFDDEHDDESENTRPGRAANWRATAWEIHPVTAIQVH